MAMAKSGCGMLCVLSIAALGWGCGDDGELTGDTDGGGGGGRDGGVVVPRDAGPPPDLSTWPTANEWSWNGSWAPAAADFPVPGLLDDEYGDGHDGTPVLPPGEWDWNDAGNDLANWRNFESNLGSFDPLMDSMGRQYGWRLVGVSPSVDYQGPAAYFEGSSGTDILDLGPMGSIHSFAAGNLGDGPDVLVFDSSHSLDFRTGSSLSGSSRDDDLVIAGCRPNTDDGFDVLTTTVHTGPGNDWVFVRDISRAAIDLGNGESGRTDALDPADGHDLIVLRGNTHDFRVFGGRGDDVAVWHLDDNVQTVTWLGPNFFGGGGKGSALWDDPGTDRLVLAVPADTRMVTSTPTPNGGLLVMPTDGEFVDDPPTAADPFATYCVECGTGPGGRKTIILEYNSADGSVHTGYFFVTAFEELQVGVGEGARVYRLDDVAGTATLDETLEASPAPGFPPEMCD